MKNKKKLLFFLTGTIFLLSEVFFFLYSTPVIYGQTAAFSIPFYQAKPQKYSWTTQAGRTYTNNKNPYNIEGYKCSVGEPATSNARDACIPPAVTINGNKVWLYSAQWNGTSINCPLIQADSDGPLQSQDTRTMNGSGQPDSQVPVCTYSGNPSKYPFINVTQQFTYDSSYCSNGDEVVLSSRSDPSNAACSNLNPSDMMANPQNYSQNQRNCLLFVDDEASIQACKNGQCNTTYYDSPHPGGLLSFPSPSNTYENLCSIFTHGNGTYSVNLKAYDTSGNNYGSSSFWLTVLSANVPHTITGHIFIDLNKNGTQDQGEPNYTGPITITSSAGIVTTNNGSYTISNIPQGSVTVSLANLPSGYYMTYPKNGPPPSFVATVGPGCTVDGTTGATCTTGDITNLNFAVSDTNPWFQTSCGDIRMDNGITDLLPAGQTLITTNATCTTPSLPFTGDTDPSLGNGYVSSTNQVAGGSSYPEDYSSNSPLSTSYNSLLTKAQGAGISPTNLSSICNLTNCKLPLNLPHGIYIANGDVNLNAYTIPVGYNYVFLINGNLTIDGNITVPVGSTALFSTTKTITVAATTPQISTLNGWYIAGQSFFVDSQGSCTDVPLTIAGSVVINATGAGGTFQNKRDLRAADTTTPAVSFTQRLDMILNAPQFLKQQQTISQELAP